MSQQDKLDERSAELIQGALDGELSAAEQAELDALLSESAAARAQLAGFASLKTLLDEEPQAEPPEYLKNVILANVTLPAKPIAKEKTGLFSKWSDSFSMRSGFALTLAAVLVAGIYQMGSDPTSSVDSTQMVGTVVPDAGQAQPRLLSSIDIDTALLDGVVQLQSDVDLLMLDFKLDSAAANQVRVNLADSGLRYDSVESRAAAGVENNGELVSATGQAVNISSNGKLHTTLRLRQVSAISANAPRQLILEFSVGGTRVYDAKLNLNDVITEQ